MNKNFIYIIIFSLLLSSCGGSDDVKNEFYKKKEIVPQNLEVTVEASGMVEAISSIEIKSKGKRYSKEAFEAQRDDVNIIIIGQTLEQHLTFS